MNKFFIIFMIIMIFAGCEFKKTSLIQVDTIGNPNAEKVLEGNQDANILMYRDIIYNAGITWVNELKLTKDKKIAEITRQSADGKKFVNGTANKLPVGTKIFSVKERGDILISETVEGDLRFYNLVEG